MTVVVSTNAAVTRYYRLRDRHIAVGAVIPRGVFQLALDGRYADAIDGLLQLDGATAAGRPGKFAAEVAPLTEQAQQAMRLQALGNIALELRTDGALEHLARTAEGLFRTRLGEDLRELVDYERSRRAFIAEFLLPAPPFDGLPQAGPRADVKPVGRAKVGGGEGGSR